MIMNTSRTTRLHQARKFSKYLKWKMEDNINIVFLERAGLLDGIAPSSSFVMNSYSNLKEIIKKMGPSEKFSFTSFKNKNNDKDSVCSFKYKQQEV